MGPKRKGKTGKPSGKVLQPKDDPEYVTALMKQMFEIQMVDIEKKIGRLHSRQTELRESTEKLEQLISDHQKEKGAVIEELKDKMEQKYSERSDKREQVLIAQQNLTENRKNYQNGIAERQGKHDQIIEEMAEKIEKMEEESKILEDFKLKKTEYLNKLEEEEKAREEAERQHQRNLFALSEKLNNAKLTLKRDVESRLLQLSFEFQRKSQTKIGPSIRRMMQENGAIEHELDGIHKSTIAQKIECDKAKATIQQLRQRERTVVSETDKFVAKCIVQLRILQILEKEKQKLAQVLNDYQPLMTEFGKLEKSHKLLESATESKKSELQELHKSLSLKREETGRMSEVSSSVRRTIRKLQIVVKSALRSAEEALAIQVIPMGETEEEMHLSTETKLKLYQKRRDSAFKKRGKILSNLRETVLRAHMTQEEWQSLSLEPLSYRPFDFHELFALPTQREVVQEEPAPVPVKESKASLAMSTSDVSLPRSVGTEVKELGTIEEGEGEEEEDEGETEGDVASEESLVEMASSMEDAEWAGEVETILPQAVDTEEPK